MAIESKKILLTVPNLQGQGGVASYYNSVIPYLGYAGFQIDLLEIGSWGRKKNIFKPLHDQMNFRNACNGDLNMVHINPSLGNKSFWRDGIFAFQAKKNKHPLLVFFHGWDHDFAQTIEKRYLRFFKNTYAKADGFIVLASEFKEKLRQWGVKAPIFVETTTVDEQLLQSFSLAKKHSELLSHVNINILFLSRLDKEKGILETINAIKILIDRDYKIKLTIAGDGIVRKEAEDLTTKLGLSDQVTFIGHVSGQNKIDTFRHNIIYCFPTSYGEGLPISVLEAMAFGMPVVTTTVGGLKDVFHDGKMGYFTESIAPNHIAEQLEKLIMNSKLSKQISEYNYHYAQENFMASKVAARIADIYQHIIGNRYVR
ncbi:MAG: glycosyltransferase involved in cell wall biosynthesis [Desulforhopalus sp.]|jgi:glycosyltransferase involved in cell wall biosynthesis